MASIINASTSGVGGVITTADNSGDLNIQSGGSTKIAVTSAGVAVTGLSKGSLPTGSVLQVVNVIKTDKFSTSSTSFIDVTGLTASITPTSSSSKILVFVDVKGVSSTATTGSSESGIILLRNATSIAVSTGMVANFSGQLSGRNTGSTAVTFTSSLSYLDSPATTSATTYKIQARAAAGTLYINTDEDLSYVGSVSTITLMEIAA